ncbi:hypothetical protein SAMN05421841_3749 [Chryseobacterium wanjuense]|jgi:hypothetical protein|uniref:Uncharacterized protein n=1 Tax=Chryseobacterium wanjuense TaxID=356305 RepID=A0A1I0S1B1_9FLAO|nr:hypothetical protein SAMN05421841_3749 [Chryseobacterium wanjuense]
MNSYEAGYNMGYITGQILTLGFIVLIIYGIVRLKKIIKK